MDIWHNRKLCLMTMAQKEWAISECFEYIALCLPSGRPLIWTVVTRGN